MTYFDVLRHNNGSFTLDGRTLIVPRAPKQTENRPGCPGAFSPNGSFGRSGPPLVLGPMHVYSQRNADRRRVVYVTPARPI
ncbi:hypothetical protein GWI33_009498 [Rhynchophorus ferrugineus]|uniref:Uncharacterized protein n=1 Tax=Rhynchophorus ferrugineus TaxID=354439 RepID=A0A834MG31_RHYFE|nr:hypothetical protein GWI33_009498 [Rhynchophorus ferrugineus]